MNDRKEFLWGAATSAHQIEGNNRHNDWWAWEKKKSSPARFRSGRSTDHWRLFREDMKRAAWLGLNSYRFSIEWSRIEPQPGRFNREALDWYSELIGECERHDLQPMLTLHHFTSPQWFAERGGFAWEGAPQAFGRFVSRVVDRLGGRIPLWCTLNEPMVLVVGAYLAGFMPPGIYAPQQASLSLRHMLQCHVLSYDLIHRGSTKRSGPWKHLSRRVGIAHNMIDFFPARFWNPVDWYLAFSLEDFYNRSWLDAITGQKQHFGIPGLIPFPKQVAEARERRTADFIGVNYYTKAYVSWDPSAAKNGHPQIPLILSHASPGETQSELGWAVHPEGLGHVLETAGSYGLPLIVTENGIADSTDRLRSQFLTAHLDQLADAQRKGIRIDGYYYWSLLDNFEWIHGFKPRFGLFEVDYKTFHRRPRPSALLYKKIIKQGL